MFKTPTKPVRTGNWLTEVMCRKGHKTYKDQMHPSGPYKCGMPVDSGECGEDV